MKKTFVMFIAVLMAFALDLGSALAESKKPKEIQTIFSKMDVNGDGVITVAEYSAYWQGQFKEMDGDKDGKITAAEFEEAARESFESMDTKKDGVLALKEYIATWCGPKAKVVDKKNIKAGKKSTPIVTA